MPFIQTLLFRLFFFYFLFHFQSFCLPSFVITGPVLFCFAFLPNLSKIQSSRLSLEDVFGLWQNFRTETRLHRKFFSRQLQKQTPRFFLSSGGNFKSGFENFFLIDVHQRNAAAMRTQNRLMSASAKSCLPESADIQSLE